MNFKSYFGTSCLILTRVSTLSQDYSPQESDLIEYAKSLGYTKWHIISTKESGFKLFDSKEGFKLVTEYLTSNPTCKTIFITELSRFGRVKSVVFQIQEYLIKNKIQLYVKDNGLKIFNEFDGSLFEPNQIMFSLHVSLAESEMRQKKERFSRAKRNLLSEGYSYSGKILFGYDKVYDELKCKNTYKINFEKANQLKFIFEHYLLKNYSISKITKECIAKGFDNYLHNKRNVNKALKEKAYTGGKITNNKRKNPEFWNYGNKDADKYISSQMCFIKYPAIITSSLFDQVQEKLSEFSTRYERNISNNKYVDKSTKHITILSKLIKCNNCGNYYLSDYRFKATYPAHTYRCASSKKPISPCDNKTTISLIMLDSVIWSYVRNNIRDLVLELQNRNNETNLLETIQEISNLLNKIKEFESEKMIENNIFRANSKLKSSNIEVLFKQYEANLKIIDNKITSINKTISEKQKLINDIRNTKMIDIDSIESRMEEIENDKEQIKYYINLIIKKIEILSTDSKITTLAVYKKANSLNDNDELLYVDFIRIYNKRNKLLDMMLYSVNQQYRLDNFFVRNPKVLYLKIRQDIKNNKYENLIHKKIDFRRFSDKLYFNDIPK